jgi:predicted RNase H-like HicB family nuclease
MTSAHYISLTLEIRREDGQFAAYCRELGTATCGDTFEEAHKNIVEAVTLDLNTLEDIGERERVFKERGIRIQSDRDDKEEAREVTLFPGSWAENRSFPIPVAQ